MRSVKLMLDLHVETNPFTTEDLENNEFANRGKKKIRYLINGFLVRLERRLNGSTLEVPVCLFGNYLKTILMKNITYYLLADDSEYYRWGDRTRSKSFTIFKIWSTVFNYKRNPVCRY